MNFLKKLKFFGKKSDLLIPEEASILLNEMVKMNPELFEAYKTYIYAKMTFLCRKMVMGNKDQFDIIQAKIQILDETIRDLKNIDSFNTEEKEPVPFNLDPSNLLKGLVENKKDNVATKKTKRYNLDDYLESKDFNGEVK